MLKKFLFVFSAVVFGLSLSTFGEEVGTAGKNTPAINKRQHNQMRRIKQGVKSGELTREEAKGLVKDEREIQGMKHNAKADGTVTPEERKAINMRLNQESKKIYEEKHDAQKK